MAKQYEIVPYNAKLGYPGRWGRYYRCPICGDIIPAAPRTSMACGCGNLLIETGMMRVKHPEQPPTQLKKRNVIKKMFYKG